MIYGNLEGEMRVGKREIPGVYGTVSWNESNSHKFILKNEIQAGVGLCSGVSVCDEHKTDKDFPVQATYFPGIPNHPCYFACCSHDSLPLSLPHSTFQMCNLIHAFFKNWNLTLSPSDFGPNVALTWSMSCVGEETLPRPQCHGILKWPSPSSTVDIWIPSWQQDRFCASNCFLWTRKNSTRH